MNQPTLPQLFRQHHDASQELNKVYDGLETLNARKTTLKESLKELTGQIQQAQQAAVEAQAKAIVEEKEKSSTTPLQPTSRPKRRKP